MEDRVLADVRAGARGVFWVVCATRSISSAGRACPAAVRSAAAS
ncbi:hypothetical protein [Streptomyces sp. NPDC051183]